MADVPLLSGVLFGLADPLRWHAHFVVVVLEWNAPLHARDFVSIGYVHTFVVECQITVYALSFVCNLVGVKGG